MKAMLTSYDHDKVTDEEIIEIDDRYDPCKGPHDEYNENYCPIVGSNQTLRRMSERELDKIDKLEQSLDLLRECPYCGSKDYSVSGHTVTLGMGDSPTLERLKCNNCTAITTFDNGWGGYFNFEKYNRRTD